MYEEQLYRAEKLAKENKELKIENSILKQDVARLKKNSESKIVTEVEKSKKPLLDKIDKLTNDLNVSYQEINRLKTVIEEKTEELDKKDYRLDKAECSLHKNSSNSSIPTSKEMGYNRAKTGANSYNHREKTNKKTGGQFGHKGKTLTKEQMEQLIQDKNLKVVEIKHYINGDSSEEDIIKYKVGIKSEVVVEKHVFINTVNSKEKLPVEFYSNVTYDNSIKSLVTILDNYYSIGYNKIKELLSDITDGIIDISEGTVYNIYDEFSNKSEETLANITNNILNSKYDYTDETVTKENGKDTYYRGYANKLNVIYRYHHHKGDKPIEEDGILTNFIGTIISDHDVGVFKYGTNHQDCIVHLNRYFKELIQNICNLDWVYDLSHELFKLDRERYILKKYGRTSFTEQEIELALKDIKAILDRAETENECIESSYWKGKANTVLNRLQKTINYNIFFIYDFEVDSNTNFIERALRMIKSKTKVSGGFRSQRGAINFGNTMSVVKTAKLRKINPFICITDIFNGKELFG